MGSCSTCVIFTVWQNAADSYATTVTEAIAPYSMTFLGAVLGLYWTIKIGGYMAGKDFKIEDLAKEVLLTVVASTFLTFPSLWMDFVQHTLNFGVSLAQFMVDPNGGSVDTTQTGIAGLIAAVGGPLQTITNGVLAIMSGTDWTEIGLVIGAALLWFLFAGLWLLIVWDATWFYSKFILIQVLGPIILVALAVPFTRGLASQAWKILLTGVIEFMTLGVIVGLANHLLKVAFDHMPIDASGKVTSAASAFLFGEDYLTAMICGALLIFLRDGFKHLAAQLADSVADKVGAGPLSYMPQARLAGGK
ncbi:MAG TPA: hypothetical protein VND94_19000 [Terriglobia bacterium]|nr:hypothetical protein [Terriglobia bacterium]